MSPRPRFSKLVSDKREHILRVAGQAFGEHGYDGATIGHILGRAGISTGAAYYYFDDKADLFIAALTYYMDRLLAAAPTRLEASNPEAFWEEFASATIETIERAHDVHRIVAGLRAAWKSSPELRDLPDVAEQFERNEVLMRSFFHRGREVGAIRTDLPDSLLLRCALAIDAAFDEWLEEDSKTGSPPAGSGDVVRMVQVLVSLLRGMFAPPDSRR